MRRSSSIRVLRWSERLRRRARIDAESSSRLAPALLSALLPLGDAAAEGAGFGAAMASRVLCSHSNAEVLFAALFRPACTCARRPPHPHQANPCPPSGAGLCGAAGAAPHAP